MNNPSISKVKLIIIGICIIYWIYLFSPVSTWSIDATDAPTCATLLHPLETKVEAIKARGGIWGMFDQNHFKVNHSPITLKLDSKVTVLILRLNHLCSTQNGVPLDEVAQILIPRLKAKGEQLVMQDLIGMGHIQEEAERLIAYARFAESNLNRKLEFDQITETITKSQLFIDRMTELSQKIGEVEAEKIMNDLKILTSGIEKFLTTNPFLVLADKENSEIPHAHFLTSNSDTM